MLYIPKKNNKLCTIIDVWKQNKNMIRDVTSFPNQEQIQMDDGMRAILIQDQLLEFVDSNP